MIIDALAQTNARIECDVCVVGAGPAGIAIASELGSAGLDVVLLESGGERFTSEAHDLNRGEVRDPGSHGPLDEYRRRRLGGASTAWGGRCVPFDEVDFQERSDVPSSGWPFGRAALDPYYRRAHLYCDLGAFSYRAAEALPSTAAARPMIPGLNSQEITTSYLYRFSPPTNFGKKYSIRLGLARSVRVLLNATCLNIATNAEGTRTIHLDAVAGARRFQIAARTYVLAAGALEVTRLMLASTERNPSGIGNQHGLVGRFYMCHVTHHLDVELSSNEAIWDYEKTADGVYCQRTLAVRPERQRDHGLLNHRARIEHPDIADAEHRNGVLSAAYLAKTMLTRMADNPLLSDKVSVLSRGTQNAKLTNVTAHARNMVHDLAGVLRFSRRWLQERILSARKLPSIVLRSPANRYTLRFDAEQAPNPLSRVSLSGARDALGLRRLEVDWRFCELDKRSVERAATMIGQALVESGAGKILRNDSAIPVATGGHHLGTTRMATEPTRGVVDENCRVHGMANLYVASASVFPTSSYANPTLTVLALALRLADHLVQQRGG